MDMLLAIVQIISTLILAIGLFVTAKQFYNSNLQERTKNVLTLWNLLNESQIRDIYYKIEYEEFSYDSQFHHSPDEQNLDKMLHIFDLYAKLCDKKLLTIDDLNIIAYEYQEVYKNEDVQKYLDYIEKRSLDRKITNPFADFNAFAQILVNKHRDSKSL